MEGKQPIQLNEKLFLKDPTSSEVGSSIVTQGAAMMEAMGLEAFTFKKLAIQLKTNESSIYRYFENKHRLLLYLVDYYWQWLEQRVLDHTHDLTNPQQKIDAMLKVIMLRTESNMISGGIALDLKILHRLVIKEGSKCYLTSHVAEDNSLQLFKPYKDLCARIADIFLEVNPAYPYARSLSSTVLEMAHFQYFFMHNLPRLTDFGREKDELEIVRFLKHLITSSLATK